ncbi:MAG: cytochrome D1 domain-containing protein [Gammaproteobacteria bacterium]
MLASSQVYSETVFVTLEKDNALAVVDPIDGKLLKTVPVGQRPRGIVISRDHRHLCIAASDDDTIQVVDTNTFQVIVTLPSGEDPETFAMSPGGDRLYVANEDDSLITIIDIQAGKAVKKIPVGVEPEPVAVSPDEKWVAGASEATNMVLWIDRETLEVADNTLVEPRPRGLSFTADSQQLWVTSELGGSVSIKDVAVLGASMGGSAAGIAASQARPGEISRLILLSPVSIPSPEKMQTGRILYIASQKESGVSAIKAQFQRAPEPKQLILLNGRAHAQHIFKTDEKSRLTETIINFLQAD